MDLLEKIGAYSVTYTVPGQTDRSAMPMGNGELCASVFVSEDGVLRLYLARTDALLENDVTAKLGMIRIRTEPNFLSQGGFRQTLVLPDGRIEVQSALGKFELFIPPQTDTLYIKGAFATPVKTHVAYHTWRKQDRLPKMSPWLRPTEIRADVVKNGDPILFYHANGENGIQELAAFQGVREPQAVPDFLTGRIFGGRVDMADARSVRDGLECYGSSCAIRVTTCSGQFPDAGAFENKLEEAYRSAPGLEPAYKLAAGHWHRLWQDSYILVEGDEPAPVTCTLDVIRRAAEPMECNAAPSQITRAYLLTRYMFACCKDGAFPILYNGALFNLTPGAHEHLEVETFAGTYTSQPDLEPTEEFNPDERSWTIEHLWQNLRLPYYSMLATGDFEALRGLFRYMLRFQELNRQRAFAFYGARGQHNAEMNLSSGLLSADIYGRDRSTLRPGQSQNSWGGSIEISPGLELLNLMLDYCAYTGDQAFLLEEVAGYARDLFAYLDTRFPKDASGRISIEDINCVETYFHTTNPITIVAGMHAVLKKLLEAHLPGETRDYFDEILKKTPALPLGREAGEEILLPAQVFTPRRWNIELPELYAVYPFALFTHTQQNDSVARTSFDRLTRRYGMLKPHVIGRNPGTPGFSGWHYIGPAAALLGKREECGRILRYNSALQNPGNRFPAMWGAVHDAVPDVDHGANILNLLQLMVLQPVKEKIYILPAFPWEWSVSFRLHAPQGTVVTCRYEKGSLVECETQPPERMADVVICVQEEHDHEKR